MSIATLGVNSLVTHALDEPLVFVSASDTGSGVDAVLFVSILKVATDTVSSSEAFSLSATITQADTGSSLETFTESATLPVQTDASGSPGIERVLSTSHINRFAGGVASFVTHPVDEPLYYLLDQNEFFSAVDSGLIRVISSDTCIGVENGTQGWLITAADTGHFLDIVGVITTTVMAADSGSGLEAALIKLLAADVGRSSAQYFLTKPPIGISIEEEEHIDVKLYGVRSSDRISVKLSVGP